MPSCLHATLLLLCAFKFPSRYKCPPLRPLKPHSESKILNFLMSSPKSSSSQHEAESMSVFEAIRKAKRLRLFEPSLGVLGFVVVTVFVICCFFYSDNGYFASRIGFLEQPQRFAWLWIKGSTEPPRVEFLGEKGGGCDFFDGEWVWDESYPLYQSKDCSFLDEGFRCSENGRRDLFYTKWRWQPKGCNLPRYTFDVCFPLLSF